MKVQKTSQQSTSAVNVVKLIYCIDTPCDIIAYYCIHHVIVVYAIVYSK